MVSNKLIVAAFAALASVANASPCKPSSTKAITTSATETASAGFTSKTSTGSSTSVETNTAITESETVTESETAATEALSTEASTTVAESATTTTTVDEPLLTNAGFDDSTTAPWQLLTQHQDTLVLGRAFQGSASGKVQFGTEDGSQYSNIIIQKINKKSLKTGSYVLEGRTRVDDYSDSGDGCSTIIASCLMGATGSWVPVPGSISRESAENSYGHWYQTATTCTFTDEMLSGDADISVVFGFFCANSGAYLDSVELKPAAVIPNTDTTTVATNSETSMIITTTQETTMATSTEGSTIATETATTTTAADADPTPLLINGNFDLDTTEPWLSTHSESVDRDTNSPFEGPASGRLLFGVDGGLAYNNYFYQKIDTKDLKAASYRLSGLVRVDYYNPSISGDGCNSMAVGCTLGNPNNLNRVPGSTVMGTPSVAVDNWFPLDTTCTLTEEMLSQYDYVSVTFGFSCAEVGANLDAVAFQEVV
ncbi:hypothetical protein NW761_002846 [Fusarium oxysporum]|nr:hypothetical protein NW758_001972 [Fusarium oxysporum]KAJ4070006.1 hypothetical protein NW753_000883 [Fusarium oxysporum]KAJ4071323.1 hypothetical protein NW763_000340 [Fusarium oxysporum]KAJ4099878.1 hypothetical protein NW761_002846 [Fusarium oxysporum]KAJ4101903.1 hypothetical protein NW756_002331 [Fusarium oxysporum]